MMTGSPLFKNLGLASGLDGLDGQGPSQGAPSKTPPPPPPKPGSKVIIPGSENIPLYVPEDEQKLVKIQDIRKVNPATGQPFKRGGAMTTSAKPQVVSHIIRQAVNRGIDPNTALAIALQETKMGNLNEEVGSAWGTMPDEGIENPYEKGANSMVKALADKLAYAKQLGFDKKGEAYALQAYNGYGKLAPRNTDPDAVENFYEIPTTHKNPINMAQNPVYGKSIISLRDEIIKKNSELQALIQKELAARKQQTPMQAPALAYSPQ